MQTIFKRKTRTAILAVLLAGSAPAWAQTTPQCLNGPPGQIWQNGMVYEGYPQPRPGMTPGYAPPSQTTSTDGLTTIVKTANSLFPESDPWDNPTNLLPTVYADVFDSLCNRVPNTTPSTPQNPYNLHPAPVVTSIDKASPYEDLDAIIKGFRGTDEFGNPGSGLRIDPAKVQLAIDILEGNPIPGRMYSGFPVLHYNGPTKFKQVQPIKDANGNTIGGNVAVHMIYYRSHIESDTSLLDVSLVRDVPWTVSYTVDTLDKGADDFSPSTMYFDDPNAFGGLASGASSMRPLVMMDLTFFPQKEGTRTQYEVAMAPGRYFNGTYTWGWRVHPGRVQFMENKDKMVLGDNLRNWEIKAFGATPMADHASQVTAINQIGNLAPEKRMWNALNKLKSNPPVSTWGGLVSEIEAAFDDWDHRSRLPRDVVADPSADIVLFYANNTIYAQVKGYSDPGAHIEYTNWITRTKGNHAKIQIINADYFDRGYMSVDFGGMRGWENTFQNTIPAGGDGTWFTFGREHWWPNVSAVKIPAALPSTPTAKPVFSSAALTKNSSFQVKLPQDDPNGVTLKATVGPTTSGTNGDVLGIHYIDLTWNFDPARRLRFYQFDPLHHDVAVFSMH